MRRFMLLSTLLILAVTTPGNAACPTVTIMTALAEGDAVTGVGLVTRIDNLAVNSLGKWLVEADTDFATTTQDQVLVNTGALYLREDDPLPPAPARLSSFDSINLNDEGNSGWNFFLRNTGLTTNDSGIYFNTSLLIQESNVSTAPEFSPGTRYIGFFDAKINANNMNQIMLIASIDDTAIATTVDRAIVRLDLDGSGNLVSETALWKEEDQLPGQTEFVADFGTGPHQSAFNDNADVLYFADLTGATTTDGVIYKNGTLLAQEGSASVVGDRNYELLSSRALDMNNPGDVVFKANLDGATTDDELIVRNGAVFVREGQTLPAISPFLLTAFGTGPVWIDDDGNVLWFGDWDDPNLDVDTGLFLNDCLIVQEGVTTVGGVIIDTIQGGENGFAMSRNGQWILFEGVLVNGIEGAFLIEVAEPIAVELASFEAAAFDGAIEISWATAREEDHLGFRLLRSRDRETGYVPVGEELIRKGEPYRYRDSDVEPGITYWYKLEALDRKGGREEFGPLSARLPVEARWALAQSHPNPLKPGETARIAFQVGRPGPVSVKLFDSSGRLVRTLLEESVAAGSHEAFWDGRDGSGVPSPGGIYFYRLETAEYRQTKKLLFSH